MATALAGAYLFIKELPGAKMIILISIVIKFLFAIPALMEIHKSKNIDMSEKIVWTIGLLFSTSLAGLFYLAFRRNKVLGHNS